MLGCRSPMSVLLASGRYIIVIGYDGIMSKESVAGSVGQKCCCRELGWDRKKGRSKVT